MRPHRPRHEVPRAPASRHVLVVTRNPSRLAELVSFLTELGYAVEVVANLDDDPDTDLVVVDLTAGDLWPLAEEMAAGRLMLVLPSVAEMRRGFDLGADDIVLADTPIAEVAARCEAILRRTASPPGVPAGLPAVYADRRLWINFDSRQVWVGGRPAQLTPREFRLLRVLITRRDETHTHEELLDEVWGRFAPKGRTPEVLKQYIWRLRQKIEPDPNTPSVIVTDPGEGYRFVSQGD
jgi:two-component system KDP operon response regulator KdpE